jgi:hypothetical protein
MERKVAINIIALQLPAKSIKMPTRFAIDCELDYSVNSPTKFLFNIQAAAVLQQKILKENLLLSGAAATSWRSTVTAALHESSTDDRQNVFSLSRDRATA